MADERNFGINAPEQPNQPGDDWLSQDKWKESRELDKLYTVTPPAPADQETGNPATDLLKSIVKGTVYGVPEQLSKVAQTLGIGGEPGSVTERIQQWGKAGLGTEEKNAWKQAGEMIPMSTAIPLLGAALRQIPSPYGATQIIGNAMMYATPVIFGLAQARETRETAEGNNVEPGIAPTLNGVIEWSGETLANMSVGRLFGPLATIAKGITSRSASQALKGSLGDFVKTLVFKTLPTENITEIGQQFFQSLVDKGYNIRPDADPVSESLSVIAPTTIMTMFIGPFARVAQTYTAGKISTVLATPADMQTQSPEEFATWVQARKNIANQIEQMIPEDQTGTRERWREYSDSMIQQNQPISMNIPMNRMGLEIETMRKSPYFQQENDTAGETPIQGIPENWKRPIDVTVENVESNKYENKAIEHLAGLSDEELSKLDASDNVLIANEQARRVYGKLSDENLKIIVDNKDGASTENQINRATEEIKRRAGAKPKGLGVEGRSDFTQTDNPFMFPMKEGNLPRKVNVFKPPQTTAEGYGIEEAVPQGEAKLPPLNKEPHEMTQEEFIEEHKKRANEFIRAQEDYEKDVEFFGKDSTEAKESKNKMDKASIRMGSSIANTAHQGFIKDALSQGKEVPQEVLNSYPELKNRAKPSKPHVYYTNENGQLGYRWNTAGEKAETGFIPLEPFLKRNAGDQEKAKKEAENWAWSKMQDVLDANKPKEAKNEEKTVLEKKGAEQAPAKEEEGQNPSGSTYKSKTTVDKDGIITKKFVAYKQGKELTGSGKQMSVEDFISEYGIKDEDSLDILNDPEAGYNKITVREVRDNNGKLGIDILAHNADGFVKLGIAGEKLAPKGQEALRKAAQKQKIAAATPEKKEPHRMTLKNYIASHLGPNYDEKDVNVATLKKVHEAAVQEAIDKGVPVSPAIRAEYPGIKRQTPVKVKEKVEKRYATDFSEDSAEHFILKSIDKFGGIKTTQGMAKDSKNRPKIVQVIPNQAYEDTIDIRNKLIKLGVTNMKHGAIHSKGGLYLDKLAQEMNDPQNAVPPPRTGGEWTEDKILEAIREAKSGQMSKLEKQLADYNKQGEEKALENEREYFDKEREFYAKEGIDPEAIKDNSDEIKRIFGEETLAEEDLTDEEIAFAQRDADDYIGMVTEQKPVPISEQAREEWEKFKERVSGEKKNEIVLDKETKKEEVIAKEKENEKARPVEEKTKRQEKLRTGKVDREGRENNLPGGERERLASGGERSRSGGLERGRTAVTSGAESAKTEGKPELRAASAPQNLTAVNVINDGFNKIKAKIGEKKAQEYFKQADKLINPNQNNIVEYRSNGIVTKDGNSYTFHALSGMDTNNWRIAFTNDITEQFTAPQIEAPEPKKLSGIGKRSDFGEKNVLVTKAEAQEALNRLLKGEGINDVTQVPTDLVRVATYYIEGGARRFLDFARNFMHDLEGASQDVVDKCMPWIKKAYVAARDQMDNAFGTDNNHYLNKIKISEIDKAIKDFDFKKKQRIVVSREDFTTILPDEEVNRLVPENIRKHLTYYQAQGVASALKSLPQRHAFLFADGTGVGKTREILSLAKMSADKGEVAIIIAPNEVLGKPYGNKGIISGSYANDAKAMGIELNLTKGDTPMQNGKIYVCSYYHGYLSKLVGKRFGSMFIDECQAAKKNTSAQGAAIGRIMRTADNVVYASATPADKAEDIGYLSRLGTLEGRSYDEQMRLLGMRKITVQVRDKKSGRNYEKEVWQVDPRVGTMEVNRRMERLFERITQQGAMIKREIDMDGLDINFVTVPITDDGRAVINKISRSKSMHKGGVGSPFDLKGLNKAQVLHDLRRQLEPYKIQHTIDIIKKELAENRQVVVFLSRINESESTNKVRGEVVEVIHSSEGTAKTLKERLVKEGITDIAELHGNADKKASESMSAFQGGKARVVIATVESGGTGINLDDTAGGKPRTMIIMTAPFSGISMIQAVGRIWRLNTQNDVDHPNRVYMMFADMDVDNWNSGIIAKKMRTLNALVGGQIPRLNVALVDPKELAELGLEDVNENEPLQNYMMGKVSIEQEALKYDTAEEFVKAQNPYSEETHTKKEFFKITGKFGEEGKRETFLVEPAGVSKSGLNKYWVVDKDGNRNLPPVGELKGNINASSKNLIITKDTDLISKVPMRENKKYGTIEKVDLRTKQQLTDIWNKAHEGKEQANLIHVPGGKEMKPADAAVIGMISRQPREEQAVKDVVEEFEEKTGKDYKYNVFNDLLEKYGVKIVFDPKQLTNPDAVGAFDIRKNLIIVGDLKQFMSSPHALFTEMLAHESAHALSYNALKNLDTEEARMFAEKVKGFIDGLRPHAKYAPLEIRQKLLKIMETPAELISYGFTNKEFASWLNSINVRGEKANTSNSIWAQFKNIIKEFIGSVTPISRNKLDELTDLMDEYMDINMSTPDLAGEMYAAAPSIIRNQIGKTDTPLSILDTAKEAVLITEETIADLVDDKDMKEELKQARNDLRALNRFIDRFEPLTNKRFEKNIARKLQEKYKEAVEAEIPGLTEAETFVLTPKEPKTPIAKGTTLQGKALSKMPEQGSLFMQQGQNDFINFVKADYFNNPMSMPKEEKDKMMNAINAFGGIKNKHLRYLFSLPWQNAQKSPDWKNMWDIMGRDRVDRRSNLIYGWLVDANNFLNRRKIFRSLGYDSKKADDATKRIQRIIVLGDDNLRNESEALKSQSIELGKQIRAMEKEPLMANSEELDRLRELRTKVFNQYKQIITDRAYSYETLSKGIKDYDGKLVKLNNEQEYQMYRSVRKAEDNIFVGMIRHLQNMLFMQYQKQKWYTLLQASTGAPIDEATARRLVGAGLQDAAIDYSEKISVDMNKIWDRINGVYDEMQDSEKKSVLNRYEEIADRVQEDLTRLRRYISKLTGIEDEDYLENATRELFSAYQYTRPQLKKIRKLRNTWRRWIGFFPRKRQAGKYRITLNQVTQDPTTGAFIKDEKFMKMFDSEREGEKIYDEVVKKYGVNGALPDNLKLEYSPVVKSPEGVFEGVSDVNMQKVIDTALRNMSIKMEFFDKSGKPIDIKNELWNETYNAIAGQFQSRGAAAHAMHRKQALGEQAIKGYQEEDLDQVLVEHITSMAGLITKQEAAYRALGLMANLEDPTRFEELKAYMSGQLRNDTDLDRASSALRSFSFTWFLGAMIKSAGVNSTQPIIVGIPVLGNYMRDKGIGGIFRANRVQLKATKDISLNPQLIYRKPEEWDEMSGISKDDREFVRKSIMDGSMQAQHISFIRGETSNLGRVWNQVFDVMATPFASVEKFNRVTSGLAMFRTALEYYKSKGMSHDKAVEKATEDAHVFINNVHYPIGKHNLPLPAQTGDITGVGIKTAYTFRTFTHNFLLNQLNFLRSAWRLHDPDVLMGRTPTDREIRRLALNDFTTFVHTMTFVGMFGGLLGLPFIKDIMDWIELHFGYSPKQWARKTLRGIGGETLSRLGMTGLPSVLGGNISGSLAIGVPFMGQNADTVFGVYSGLATKAQRAYEAFERGDPYRMATNISPEFIRGPLVAMEESEFGKKYLGTPGYATTTKGMPSYESSGKPLSMTGGEVAMKSMGFQPTRISEEREIEQSVKTQVSWAKEQKSLISEQFRIDRLRDPKNATKNMLKSVAELNKIIREREIPETPAKVSSIVQHAKQTKNLQQRRELARRGQLET